MTGERPLVQVDDLVVRYSVGSGRMKRFITPVDRVTFTVGNGEVLALVGESGSGKTTVGRSLVRVLEPSGGTIYVEGKDATHIKGRVLHQHRKKVQMIFQDPFGSLNTARTVEQHLAFPVRKHQKLVGKEARGYVENLLETVGLSPVEIRNKFPHELSGGQRQRVAIARTLAVSPKFLVADEPISMLDVSIRAGILKLMNQLKHDFKLSYLYITHDLASARYFGDRIMVMYGGKVMETGPSAQIVSNPTHPYTQLLLAATPGGGRRERLAETSIQSPNLHEGRVGCVFAHRCPLVTDICRTEAPSLALVEQGHLAACHHRP